jgi:hypothetical protein
MWVESMKWYEKGVESIRTARYILDVLDCLGPGESVAGTWHQIFAYAWPALRHTMHYRIGRGGRCPRTTDRGWRDRGCQNYSLGESCRRCQCLEAGCDDAKVEEEC